MLMRVIFMVDRVLRNFVGGPFFQLDHLDCQHLVDVDIANCHVNLPRFQLVAGGIAPLSACRTAISWALSDDIELQRSIEEVVTSVFEE